MERAPGTIATGRSHWRQGSAFPDALRVPISQPQLAAHALRARAHQIDGRTLHVGLDDRSGRIEVEPPFADGPVGTWPFGASRDGAAGRRDALIAAPDHPALVLVREGRAQTTMRVAEGAGIDATLEHRDDGRCFIVARATGADLPDADALIASALARARRRAARAPFVASEDGLDPIRAADYALRRTLRRTEGGAVACDDAGAPLAPAAQAAAIVALCALNDAELAADLVAARTIAWSADGALAALIVGAWAAWRGTAPDRDGIREAAQRWIEMTRHAAEPMAAAALALAPVAAEALGVQTRVARPGADELPPSRAALPRFAEAAGGPGADALLTFLHGAMGIAPDAPRGRIVIAPRLIAGRRDVEQISLGDALLAVRMNADEESASIEVEQTSGATPVTVILEPGVAAVRLRSARIDQTAAELDSVAHGSELRVKVQLVVDRPRRLELRYEL